MKSSPRSSSAETSSLTAESLWSAVLRQLEAEVSHTALETWVRPLKPVSFSDHTLTLAASNPYARDYVADRLTSTVRRIVSGMVGESVSLEVIVWGGAGEPTAEADEASSPPGIAEDTPPPFEQTSKRGLTLQPKYLSSYDEAVRPERIIAIPGYYLRWIPYLGVDLAWLPVGFRQVAFLRGLDFQAGQEFQASGREIARWSGMSLRTFRRRVQDPLLRWFVQPLAAAQDGADWTVGQDGIPHREPSRWRVVLSMPMTPADQTALTAWLTDRLQEGLPPARAVEAAIRASVEELLPWPAELVPPEVADEPKSVQTVVLDALGVDDPAQRQALMGLADTLAQRILGGPVLVTHYFVEKWLPVLGAGPGWLVTLLRSGMALESDGALEVEIEGGYAELADHLGLIDPWRIARWLSGQGKGAAELRPFIEQAGATKLSDRRVSRRFRVALTEPVTPKDQARAPAPDRGTGTHTEGTLRGIGTHDLKDPRGNGTQGGAAAREIGTDTLSGARGLDTYGRDDPRAVGTSPRSDARENSTEPVVDHREAGTGLRGGLQTPIRNQQTYRGTSTTVMDDAIYAGKVEVVWNLGKLLELARVNPRARAAIRDASAEAFVSWMLYATSERGKSINDPVGHAVSRLRVEPRTGAGGAFDRLAGLGPVRLGALLASGLEGTAGYVSIDWAEAMKGTSDRRLRALVEIMGGYEAAREGGL